MAGNKLEVTRYSQLANADGLFEMPRSFWKKVEKIYIGATIDNILKGKKAKRGSIKRNKKSTRERKRLQGKPLISLVDEKQRFLKSGRSGWATIEWLDKGTGFVFGARKKELQKLQQYTHDMGYRGYLGIGKEGQLAVRGLLREHLKRRLRKIARERAKKIKVTNA